MKKIILLVTVVVSAGMSGGDIERPHKKIKEIKRIALKGDLRLRYESIERDDKENKYRTRYRLRLGAKINLIDSLYINAGMRSGFGNPTSGNQTFHTDEPMGDYFFQSLRLNTLGLVYKSGNTTMKIGREPYMMYRPIKSQLIWDNDISMNGINYQYKDRTQTITIGVNQPTMEEKSVAENSVNLFIAQYVYKTKFNFAKLYTGTGIYYYDGLKDNTPIFGKNKGNTVINGIYANDYHIVEGFGELQFGNVFGMPLKVAASAAYNIAVSGNNFGYDLAFQLGKAKHIGEWQVKYSYTNIQEDAVLGAYSDSDNFGGGTAAKGHAIRTKYKMSKHLYFAGNFFFNKYYESKSKIVGIKPDYKRVQLDCIVKF
ncbi:MAG: putative porin [Sulfurovum sp.]|nr:putative porin [Sulfurovum sp.]MCB4750121.1 putative porin [Sulfurovum sp.]MCB4754010.1 putative porin [Sulfurovum sp.]